VKSRDVWLFVVGFILAGCVSASYATYNLSFPSDGCYKDGKLLAHDPKNDLPLTVCQPDASSQMKCTVLQTTVYEQEQIDESNCQQDLIACQKKCP
jgi:hypothetical protein